MTEEKTEEKPAAKKRSKKAKPHKQPGWWNTVGKRVLPARVRAANKAVAEA